MKKISSCLILVLCCAAVLMAASCSPAKIFFLSSDGIVTYNRHTGQFEMMWEHRSVSSPDTLPAVKRDSLTKQLIDTN